MQSLGKVQVPQTNQNNQSCLLNIIIKPLPLLCAATTSPCLMLLNHHIRSPPKLVRTTLPYPCYTQSTSHTHINPVEATHPSCLLQIPLCTAVNQFLEGWKWSQGCQNTCGH